MTDNGYQTLLQVAAGTRRCDETAALNMTYTASVAAVETALQATTKDQSATFLSPRFSKAFATASDAEPHTPPMIRQAADKERAQNK